MKCEPAVMEVVPYYSLLESGYVAPSFTDNSGAISAVLVEPIYFSFSWPITADVNVSYTVFDHFGNTNSCMVQVLIVGELC